MPTKDSSLEVLIFFLQKKHKNKTKQKQTNKNQKRTNKIDQIHKKRKEIKWRIQFLPFKDLRDFIV